MALFSPALVISVHGIRTKAAWQKPLSKLLKQNGISHEPYNFGYYGVFRFLFQPANERMVDNFYEYYSSIVQERKHGVDLDNYAKRPSVVAHSFGSYIVAYCMLKYPDVKFDKIIICGSILPRDFDWATLMMRDQVNSVLNEYGLYDFWAKKVGQFVPRTGSSGADGFHMASTQLTDKRFDYFKHSDYFRGQHVQSFWLPFLQRTPCRFVVKHGHDIEDVKEFSRTLDTTGTVIDKICFGTLAHYNDVEIPRGLSLEWIKVNPDIYSFLFDQTDNSVKGYLNAMPVDDGIFDQIKLGQMQDNEVKAEHIVPFTNNQIVKMYLMSIAIDPNARNANEGLLYLAFEKLMNGFIHKLIHYYFERSIRVTQFLAVGWTTNGKRLCKMLGMTQVGVDKYDNPVFLLDLQDRTILDNKQVSAGIRKLILTYQQLSSP